MNATRLEKYWNLLFWLLPAAYCLYYAPYGINETDGGFLTGLAWQVLCGKTLYADVVYVRPPLPVWLRALELAILPDNWAILGERWIFFWKLAVYSWLGAAVLQAGNRRWLLAAFGFVLSAHCYPPTAWHTVDGILFGVWSIWCWSKHQGNQSAFLSGIFLVGMLLCKQSFYPMALAWMVLVLRNWPAGKRRALFAGAGFLLSAICFGGYLLQNELFENYIQLTSGASSAAQAFEHGVLDYFRIKPMLLVLSVLLLAPAAFWATKKQQPKMVFWAWALFLLALTGTYAWSIGQRQEFTAPFAQTRLALWLAAIYGLVLYRNKKWSFQQLLPYVALLALSWSASVSWGYNLPVLFALPWVFALAEISNTTFTAAYPNYRRNYLPAIALFGLLAVMRWGYEFVYRDGPRTATREDMGDVFPRLNGIYSSPETAALYRDLDRLTKRYGPNFKILPAFPQANFLTNTHPPLPLDWVVKREMGAGSRLVLEALHATRPHLFIEKTYLKQIQTDPELSFIKTLLSTAAVVDESDYFQIVQIK